MPQQRSNYPPEEREELLEMLIASLPLEPGYDEAWSKELDRRVAAFEDGSAELVAGEIVFARLQSNLK